MARVLIVEDDPHLRFWMRAALQTMGYKVVEAQDGQEAWKLLSQGDQFDLIITDVQMPKMNGIELAERVSEVYPKLPIMLITAFSEPRSETVHEGVYPFLLKPTTLQKFVAAVKQMIGSAR